MLATSALSPPAHEPPWTRTMAGRRHPVVREVGVDAQVRAVRRREAAGADLDRRFVAARGRRDRDRDRHRRDGEPADEQERRARRRYLSSMAAILVLSNMYPPHHLGGYELSCRDVVDRWRAHGHDVTVLTGTMRLPGRRRPRPTSAAPASGATSRSRTATVTSSPTRSRSGPASSAPTTGRWRWRWRRCARRRVDLAHGRDVDGPAHAAGGERHPPRLRGLRPLAHLRAQGRPVDADVPAGSAAPAGGGPPGRAVRRRPDPAPRRRARPGRSASSAPTTGSGARSRRRGRSPTRRSPTTASITATSPSPSATPTDRGPAAW